MLMTEGLLNCAALAYVEMITALQNIIENVMTAPPVKPRRIDLMGIGMAATGDVSEAKSDE